MANKNSTEKSLGGELEANLRNGIKLAATAPHPDARDLPVLAAM